MKKNYLLIFILLITFTGNYGKVYAGGCTTVIDTWDVVSPTDPIYPFGFITGTYSGSTDLIGDLFYEGSFLSSYSSNDGTIFLFDLNPGSYEFFYCGGTLSQTFTVSPIPCDISILNISATNVSGAGCSANGAIDLTVGSSTPGQTFYYNITELASQAEYTGTDDGFGIISLGSLPAGIYTVYVSTDQDVLHSICNANDLITITEPACDMQINNATVVDASFGSSDGTISVEVSGTSCIPTAPGGNPFFNVYAEIGGSFYSNLTFNPASATYELTSLAPGNYSIVADNDGTSCFAATQLTVGEQPCNLSAPTITASNTVICNGSPAQLSVPNTYATYEWYYNTTPYISISGQQSTFDATLVGEYYVIVKSANGCVVSSDTVSVTANSAPQLNIADTLYSCTNNLVVTSPNTFDIYQWSTGATTASVTINTGGWYALAASVSSLGCGVVDTFFVSLNNTPPVAQINVIGANPFCQGTSITLQSASSTNNTWSNNATTQSISVNTAGQYNLTVSNSIGCTATASVNVTTLNCAPATQLTGGACGQTNFTRTSAIFCAAVTGATQYEWEFSNANGVYATKLTTTNSVLLHSVTPIISWGTTWTLRVRAIVGANIGNYSAPCTVGLMQDPAIAGVPTTQLRSQDCSLQNYTINTRNRIITNPISGAIQYEFQFSNPATGAVVATVQRTVNVLYFNTMNPILPTPAQYSVKTRARIATTWGNFGNACIIGITGLSRESGPEGEELPYYSDGMLTNEPFFTLSVAPNPYDDFTSVTINSSENENVFVQFFDMTGKVVAELNATSNEKFNAGAGLSKGIYLIKARSESGNQITARLIKTN